MMMLTFNLAQLNVAKMLAPLDSPTMADFVSNLDKINALAEHSPGFVWRLKDEGNNATSIRMFDDDMLLVNMSVWKSVEDLFRFVYQSEHVEIFKRRKEWFEQLKEMYTVLWYVSTGDVPTVPEAQQRLIHLRTHGETAHAFTFRRRFTPQDLIKGEL